MSKPSDLESQLREMRESAATRIDPARLAVAEEATRQLRASGIEANALRVGDRAPDATLPDAAGRLVTLSSLWTKGSLVIVFYRGQWCPYCNLELRAWQSKLDELAAKGASLVAISPQTPDGSLTTAEKNELAFPVLSDSSLFAAESYGIAFTMPAELQALYKAGGIDLATINGNGVWQLPVPATFVVDRTGTVVHASVDADYRRRPEPADVLAAVPATAMAA